jgi:hypothetical protein
MDRNEMRFTAALALLRDGLAMLTSRGVRITVEDIESATGFAVESADSLLRELDEAATTGLEVVEPVESQPLVLIDTLPLAAEILAAELEAWSSGRIDKAQALPIALAYLAGQKVGPLIQSLFDAIVKENKGKV